MNSDFDTKDKEAFTHQALKDLYALLSTLQNQDQLGLFPAQPDIQLVEISMPKNLAPDLEDWVR